MSCWDTADSKLVCGSVGIPPSSAAGAGAAEPDSGVAWAEEGEGDFVVRAASASGAAAEAVALITSKPTRVVLAKHHLKA